ncbi:hypothetical protein E2C01_013566 [Portunus trituberculatus]|uniref:Uncharacterized protein n=1 Tax=Portunus trituberculatus TaxID=210409 RepID=A0A5B7DHI3_PORTR|nr:hypothetical protein [Portunus trituberculatus]
MGRILLCTDDEDDPEYCVEVFLSEDEDTGVEGVSPSLTVGITLSKDRVASPAWEVLEVLLEVASPLLASSSIVRGMILVADPLRPVNLTSCWVLWVAELTAIPSLVVGMTRSSIDVLEEQLSLLGDLTGVLHSSPFS